jgi:hypothetical protein
MLDFVDEALDEVPQAVSVLVIGDLRDARYSGRDHSLDFGGRQLDAKIRLSASAGKPRHKA